MIIISLTSTLQERPAITFNYPSGSLQVNVGEEIRIVCTATGDPSPMVSWEKLNGYMLVFGYIYTYTSDCFRENSC